MRGPMTSELVLASSSPRRKFLLESVGFRVDVRVSNADETWPAGPLEAAVIEVAKRKLDLVPMPDHVVVVAADTIVAKDGVVFGKPADAADARRILGILSGAWHQVLTGFWVRRGARLISQAVVTQVAFRALNTAEIDRYVASGEPFGKAGAYAIQGTGAPLVHRLEGSYTNVMGLPIQEVIDAVAAL